MTDAPLPPDAADELASAYLDGAVTAAERAQVEADESLRARVEALAAVRTSVRATVPVDEARREAALAAALAAAEEPGGVLAAPPAASPAVPLAARWRSVERTRTVRYLAVAAAVAVVALAVPLLDRLGTEDDDADTASVALDAEASAPAGRDAAEESAMDDAAGGSAGSPPEALMADDLGPFDDLDALAATLREQPELAADAYVASTTAGGAEAMTSTTLAACDGQLTLPADAEVLLDATATLAGTPVVVVVHRLPGGEPQLLVAAVDGCTTLVDQPL